MPNVENEEVSTSPSQDYTLSPTSSSSTSSTSSSPSPKRTRSLRDIYEETSINLEEDMAYLALFDDADPIMFEEASKHKKRKVSMDNEIDAILRNKAWALVDLPEGKKSLDAKWVYKTK